ncbi:hypothetical protein ACIQRE_01710 [Streptomyces griseoluteus]
MSSLVTSTQRLGSPKLFSHPTPGMAHVICAGWRSTKSRRPGHVLLADE